MGPLLIFFPGCLDAPVHLCLCRSLLGARSLLCHIQDQRHKQAIYKKHVITKRFIKSLNKFPLYPMLHHVGRGGTLVADFQTEDRGFASRSSRHVGTLGKSFTCSCPIQYPCCSRECL